jgi:predicted ATP-dependent protease
VTDNEKLRIPAEQLRATFDPALLDFQCTDELTPLVEFAGQERATRSLEFGLRLRRPGYNIFVTGLTGTGKTTAILEYIRRHLEADTAAVAQVRDWCYVYNFEDPDRPNAIGLPAGTGRALRDDLDQLLGGIRSNIARAFASDEYGRERREVMEQGQSRAQVIIENAQEKAKQQGFALNYLPTGANLVPLVDGRPMTPDEFTALKMEERQAIAERQREVGDIVEEAGERLHAIEHDVVEALRSLDRRVIEAVVRTPFDGLDRKYGDHDEVLAYLKRLREFTLAGADVLRQLSGEPGPGVASLPMAGAPDPFLAFRVNVFVDNSDSSGPPIVIEPNPTWTNLFGRIDRRAYMGTYLSDHTMLKPGAAHQANGGYLVLNFPDVLSRPGAWDGLRRMIRTREIRLEDPMEQYGLLTPQTLRPETIAADIKVVVAGDVLAYVMLSAYDEEFWEMFKVKADFDYEIARDSENVDAYARFICAVCEREGVRHFDRSAVARLIEHGSRVVEDQKKLSARFGRLRDVIIEADYWASQEGNERITGDHVARAIDERVFRGNLVEERVREMIARGLLLIDTAGAVVGQVNGLAVLQFGDVMFGRPSRITARTYLGQRGIVSIDRESQLSGRIHSKGVLILSGYLGAQYGQKQPLSLSATISFEQGYDLVEGDSASLGETCAILSSLADVPVRQDLAITGSMNQKGEVQPIGAVNAKIEGLHDVCREMGFTGSQGVVVPARNLDNLMLRPDVVETVRAGKFHVYAVNTVDEALELLTGQPAGERGPDGAYPEASIHRRAEQKLQEMAEAMRGTGRSGDGTVIIPAEQQPGQPPKPPALPD